MTTNTITKPLDVVEARELLVRAVEAKGEDYVYVNPKGDKAGGRDKSGLIIGCYNKHPETGEASCIIGHVYDYMGVLGVVDDQSSVYSDMTYEWFTPRARWALAEAQRAQDIGKTWGEALAAFDDAVANYDNAE